MIGRPAVPASITRRDLLRGGALLATAPWLLRASAAFATGSAAAADSAATRPAGVPEGSPGEFDFLQGEWRIAHRWRKDAASKEWIAFDGQATCWSILGGIGSVEELRIPARNFSGMGLRLLDVERKLWSDFWVNSNSGVLVSPGTYGGFRGGVGTFVSEDAEGDPPTMARGVWDRITGRSHRWSQAVSFDRGATWAETWVMEWKKA